MNISKITKSLESTKNTQFPPVELWNPELCEGQEIKINREGTWFYNNSIIKNQKLVNLVASVLRKDNDDYFLVTPTEKVPVKAEIAPYMIEDFKIHDNTIELITNLNYSFLLDQDNLIRLKEIEGIYLPLITVRNSIEAFFNRNTYYRIIDLALENNLIKNNTLFIKSNFNLYPVGKVAQEA